MLDVWHGKSFWFDSMGWVRYRSGFSRREGASSLEGTGVSRDVMANVVKDGIR